MSQSQTIDNQIMNYLSFLSAKKKKAVLTVVKTFAEDENDFWDEMPEKIKKSVKKGLEESKNGLGIPHEKAFKKYEKWLKK